MNGENKFKLDFHPQSFKDYQDSVEWYDDISSTLANEFIFEVKRALKIIEEAPYRFKKIKKNYYQYSLDKFPFVIVYDINQSKGMIFISAIYHHKRNPKKKFRKL